MDQTRWKIPRGPAEAPESLTQSGCSPLLAALLNARGLGDPAAAGDFLESGAEQLGDPLLLADLGKARARLEKAIDRREHVAVYGDYDVDGITSSCMVADYLRRRGLRCELYIPNRMEEGYGVNAGAVDTLREKGVTLIITVDCGVTTVEETAYALSVGVDMIITDHHECREALPPAAAVVDPKRPDCGYPGRDLAGVGVAFKLLCALEGDPQAILDRYADLVAVGTVADVMPLTGENRYIVKRGIEKLETAPRPGLKALIEEAGLGEKRITATSIGFTLAPRLNASGRLGRVDSAISLLLTEDPEEAAERAAELCQLNRDRQAIEYAIWQEATRMIGDSVPDAPLVLAGEGWHQGVIGIAASRLTEAYSVPAVMICLDGDKGKGSCRSCGGFNLFEAFSACGEYLEGFGGHALAAGLTIRRENIPAFRAALAEYYRAHPGPGGASLDVDLCVDRPELLEMDCVEDLDKLEPCGAGNPRPLLCLLGARLTELTPIGGGKHLRLRLDRFGQSYEAVYFSHTLERVGEDLRVGDWCDAAFCPQINQFRGHRSVQLLLTDLRPHDGETAEAILEGALSPEDAADCPDRGDFVQVWRALSAAGGTVRGELPALGERLAPRLREEKLCLILKTFEELGLLKLEREKGRLRISAVPGAPKADLESSEILRSLRAFSENHNP